MKPSELLYEAAATLEKDPVASGLLYGAVQDIADAEQVPADRALLYLDQIMEPLCYPPRSFLKERGPWLLPDAQRIFILCLAGSIAAADGV
jgi:hypothetical protein